MPEPPHCSIYRHDMSNDSKRGCGKAGRRLWRTPAADGPATVACRPAHARPHPAAGPHHLCRLQRPSPLRKAHRTGRFLAQPRNPPSLAAQPVSALPANAALRLIASAVCVAREGELVQLDGSPHDWLRRSRPAPHCSGHARHAGRCLRKNPRRSVLSFGNRRRLSFACCRAACAAHGVPTGLLRRSQRHLRPQRRLLDRRGTTRRPTPDPPSSAAPWTNSASPSSPRNRPKPKAASSASGACCKIASPANSVWPTPRI